ncbi:P2 family phage major capsid protein [Pasteurella multocida]
MENLTVNKYRAYIQHLSNSLKLDNNGALFVYNLDPKQEKQFFANLKKNSFFGLINVIKSRFSEGNTLGIQIPMPSTTDTDREERQPDKAYIEPFQRFYCEQINIDSCVSYPKLDSLASYLDKDFDQELERYLDKQTLLSLLMVGFNGKKRTTETTSTPAENKLAEDVKKGWLQQIREEKASVVITGANVGEGQQYKNLNALIKAGLAKIENPHKMHGDLVAICGRNVLADYPVVIEYDNLSTEKTAQVTISQKLIGGLKAFNVPYMPENSILITRLDNLSLYVHTGTIRRMLETNSRKDRLEHYFSMSLDFIVENYDCVALLDNIQITD